MKKIKNLLLKKNKTKVVCLTISKYIFEASIEEQKKQKLKRPKLPFWRIIDENMPIFKKLSISKSILNKYESEFNEKN